MCALLCGDGCLVNIPTDMISVEMGSSVYSMYCIRRQPNT